jgi:hypothetical protein
MSIKTAAVHQTRSEAQRHRRVISPLTWFEMERAAPNHVRDRLERTSLMEL